MDQKDRRTYILNTFCGAYNQLTILNETISEEEKCTQVKEKTVEYTYFNVNLKICFVVATCQKNSLILIQVIMCLQRHTDTQTMK